MYPPKISDPAVRSLIRELRRGQTLPSGAQLRAELARRFGCRGGVRRIYALLAQERESHGNAQRGSTGRSGVVLEPANIDPTAASQIAALRAQLDLAREREESHQSRWAVEIDRLRLRLSALEPLAAEAAQLREINMLLRHRLQAAELRVSQLEQQLFAVQEPGRAGE